ncbi:MAG TPA: hypothetical protein VLT47_11650 [Anaeromyxobacteraceae bacterium]|nr:hypothetical protein [Anaeromyxobacteraceae bacterium]
MIALCAALLLAAPPAGLYRGAIGVVDSSSGGKALPIVMLLESPSEGVLKGRYFYWKQRRDIVLDGTYQGGRISLQERVGEGGAVSGTFSGSFETNGWSGTWATASKSRQLPVTMSRVGDGSVEELERWRRGLVRGTQSANGLTWEWRAARASPGIALPFLVKSNSAAVAKKVNAAMQLMLDQMGCEAGGEWTTRSAVASSRRDVFSVSIHSSYYCGGPYPTNDANESVTFDLRTGEKIELWSLFSAPREAVLKTLLAARIGEGSEPEGGECPKKWPLEEALDFTLDFAIEEDGIVVQPEFPHVMEGCAFEEKIPFARLTRIAPPDGVIARLARK